MILHFEPMITEISGKKFFLAHGDGLGDVSRSFHLLRKMFHSRFLRKCFAAIHPRWTMPLAHSWSNLSRENSGVQPYRGEDKEYLIRFAKETLPSVPDINYFIFGHRHLLLDLPIAEQSRVIMLGDWITLFLMRNSTGRASGWKCGRSDSCPIIFFVIFTGIFSLYIQYILP